MTHRQPHTTSIPDLARAAKGFPAVNEEDGLRTDKKLLQTGVNDHAWQREHRHPAAAQASAIGNRRREAEAKLSRHQQQARYRATE